LQHFQASEFKLPDKMDALFLLFLDAVRDRAGMGFVLNSDASLTHSMIWSRRAPLTSVLRSSKTMSFHGPLLLRSLRLLLVSVTSRMSPMS